jgi:hypothetical protein
MPEWMKLLSREKDNEDFSELCHQYFKLGTMRVMQEIRNKYSVPPEEVPTLTIAIFARFFNEGVYAIGAAIKSGMKLDDILEKEHTLNLLKVLMGESLDPMGRSDIEVELPRSLEKFKEFIIENASTFYTKD